MTGNNRSASRVAPAMRIPIAIALVTACQRSEPPDPPPAPAPAHPRSDPGAELRDEARLVLERWCADCHVSDYPTAIAGALAVFDLREPEWHLRMTDEQLRSALERFGPTGGSEASEPSPIPPEDRETVVRFVDEEITRRKGDCDS